jgi:hypothetical protein
MMRPVGRLAFFALLWGGTVQAQSTPAGGAPATTADSRRLMDDLLSETRPALLRVPEAPGQNPLANRILVGFDASTPRRDCGDLRARRL